MSAPPSPHPCASAGPTIEQSARAGTGRSPLLLSSLEECGADVSLLPNGIPRPAVPAAQEHSAQKLAAACRQSGSQVQPERPQTAVISLQVSANSDSTGTPGS